MTGRQIKQRWMRAIPAVALTLSVGLAGDGCSDNPMTMMPGNEPPPLGATATLTPASTSGNYMLPLDSVPSSDGSVFYFTAATNTGAMGVFSVPATGGAATQLAAGAPLVSPFGIAISSDDKTLYIADASAGYDPNDPAGSDMLGQVLTLTAAGGTPMPVASTTGYRPKGIEIWKGPSGDVVYFSGHNAATGKAGVYSMAIGTGGVSTVYEGDTLIDPSGVTVAADGTVYVVNTTSPASGTADVYKLGSNAATAVVGGIKVGYPAGLAISQDGKTLLISGQDRDLGTTVVHRYDLSTSTLSQSNMGIDNNTDAGGLHRAKAADTFSWCGVTAGTGGQGIVYRVSFN